MKVQIDAHWYREEDSTVCTKGPHTVKRGSIIQTITLGPYFFDFCYRHAPFKNLRHKIAFMARVPISNRIPEPEK